MEIIQVESIDGELLDIKVAKRFKRVICCRSCNVMRFKTSNFSEIKAGVILYDVIINDVGTILFRKSIYGEYYGSTIKSFFTEYDSETINKLKKIDKLREQYRAILTEVNSIESSITEIYE